MARLGAAGLGILNHYARHPRGVRLHGPLHPLTQAAAHQLAPTIIRAPAPAINRYGIVPGGGMLGITNPQTQAELDFPAAAQGAVDVHGQVPDYIRAALQNTGILGQVERARVARVGGEENLGQPSDLINAIVGAATLGAGPDILGAFKAGQAGAEALAGSTADTTAGKILQNASRAVTAPIRHPVVTASTPVAAQVPEAVEQGNPGDLLHGLSGGGAAASVLGGAGGGIRGAIPGFIGNAAADAVELPAQVLPSTYLTLKAGANAVAGNPAELDALTKSYNEQSALAALLHGNLGQALQRAGQHPLYTALEAEGVRHAVGFGTGALLRHAPGETGERFAAGRQRPPLDIYGGVTERRGPYSNDAITRTRQERQDARRGGGWGDGTVKARDPEIIKYLHGLTDREVYASEVTRKGRQAETSAGAEDHRPSRQGRHRARFASKAGKADDLVAGLQTQGIVHHEPGQARLDLAAYKQMLDESAPNLPPSDFKVNRRNARDIEHAIAHGNLDNRPALEAAASRDRGVTDELIQQGHLTADQAEKARALGYAHGHMKAGYGLSNADEASYADIKREMADPELSNQERGTLLGRLSRLRSQNQTLDEHGNPLSTEQIHAHAREHGYDPELWSYLSHETKRPEGMRPSGYYSPPTDRPTRLSKKRTGAGVRHGTFDFSYDAVVQSAIKSRTLADQTKNFEHFANRVGLRQPNGDAFLGTQQARHFAEHPEDYGAKLPHVPGGYVPLRLTPFLSRKEVLDAVSGLGQNKAEDLGPEDITELLDAESHGGEGFMRDALAEALKNGKDPAKDGPVVLVPKVIAQRFEEHFQKSSTGEKFAQAANTAFKGAILPTSIKWFAGNAIDNWIIRGLGTGLTPLDIRTGKQFGELINEHNDPEVATRTIESIITGGVYGSVPKMQPYRDATQFETSRLYPLVKGAHDLLQAPGVKTVADSYRAYRDAVFHLDGKYVEQLPQYAELSRTARKELGLTRRRWRKAIATQEPAVINLAKGFRNPDQIDHFAKSVERVFGNWGKNGPAAKRFLNNYAPFWQWARAATKFAVVTLPKDHPVLTGLLAASQQMTREEREKLGFDLFSPDRLPTFLQGGLPNPLEAGGVLDTQGLTTFGEFGNYPEAIGSNFLPPLLQNAYLASIGVKWDGDKLQNSEGGPANELEAAKAAIFGTAESFFPFLNLGKSVQKHGTLEGLNPARAYDAESVESQRQPREEISVPVNPSSSGGGGWGASSSSSSSSSGSGWGSSSSSSSSGGGWE